MKKQILFSLFCMFLFCAASQAQTTAFTYQGRFADSTVPQPTNGTYQMQFALFDAGGAPVGAAITAASVQVVSGIFTVNLDFGAGGFTGADRFLEIRVFNAATSAYVALSPRQPITSTPYSIRSKDAATADVATNTLNVGGTPANQIIKEGDTRLSDNRTPTSGSANYIQNTTTQQSLSNFNVSGTGAANIFNAVTQYNIGGSRVLSVGGTNNVFAGVGSGAANTTGEFNAFFGAGAGLRNTNGSLNAFFGGDAGQSNTTGTNNSFLGFNAGYSNTIGSQNSFVGRNAGFSNTSGSNNSFVGFNAGQSNTTGSNHSFFGRNAGFSNTTGEDNSFFGRDAGYSNTTGKLNSFLGANAGLFNTTGEYNSFLGADAGFSNTTGSNNSFFGAAAGKATSGGSNNSFFGADAGKTTSGSSNTFVGAGAGTQNVTGANITLVGASANVSTSNLTYATAIGAGASVATNNTLVLGRNEGSDTVRIPGSLNISVFGGTSTSHLCISNTQIVVVCSSSLRYKTNIAAFSGGLEFIRQLRPITYNWKDGGMPDVGFGAEDVAKINSLFTVYDNKGEVLGVKYDRFSALFVNAFKEQQTQIEAQQTQIEAQRHLIDSLKKLVCADKPQADICQ